MEPTELPPPQAHSGGLLKPDDVQRWTSLNRVTIWRKVKDGTFPAPIRLSAGRAGRIAWRLSDVEAWVEACAARPAASQEA
jgi:prophage regulatory protein